MIDTIFIVAIAIIVILGMIIAQLSAALEYHKNQNTSLARTVNRLAEENKHIKRKYCAYNLHEEA